MRNETTTVLNGFRVAALFRFFFAALSCIIALHASGVYAQIQQRNLRFGIGTSESHSKGLAVKYLADMVAKETGGKIKITLFADGKIGSDKTMIADLQNGALDLTSPDSSTLIALNKGFGVLNFPFLFDQEDDAEILLDGSFGTKLLDSLTEHGIIGLVWWVNGFRNTTNNVRPIQSAKDFEGLKIRVMENPIFIDMFKALGAEPVEMPYPRVYDALKDRKVDGQENPAISINTSKLYEVQRYLTLTRHVFSVCPVLISKKTWDSLSSEEKKIFRTAVQEATLFERKSIRETSRKAIEDLQKAGMKVNDLTPSEQAHFRQLLRPVTKKYRAEFGEKWTDEFYMGRMQIELDRFKNLKSP